MKTLLLILATLFFTACKTTNEKSNTAFENRQQSRDRN